MTALLLLFLFATPRPSLDYMRWWLDHPGENVARAEAEKHDREQATTARRQQCAAYAIALSMYSKLYWLYTHSGTVDVNAERELPRTKRAIKFFEKRLKPCLVER